MYTTCFNNAFTYGSKSKDTKRYTYSENIIPSRFPVKFFAENLHEDAHFLKSSLCFN